MAMPYPEGEVFFKRSVLKIQTPPEKLKDSDAKREHPWSYDANNFSDFASHILVEYIWNRSTGSNNVASSRYYHTSSTVGKWTGYYPQAWYIMFSKTEKMVYKAGQLPAIQMDSTVEIIPKKGENADVAFRDRAKGGPDKIAIVPVPVSQGAKYMFIDQVMPIRAIYFPLAHTVDKSIDPDLCTFLMVDFRFRKGVKMMFPDDQGVQGTTIGSGAMMFNSGDFSAAMPSDKKHPYHREQRFSYKEGLGEQPLHTLQLDIRGVYNYLMVPRQLRNPEMGLYFPAEDRDVLIKCRGHRSVMHAPNPVKRDFQLLDYADVISDHFGVDVTWQPYEYKEEASTLVSTLFHLGVQSGLSLIPGVGPLVSAGYGIFIEAVTDPKKFKEENVLKLDGDVSQGVSESAAEALKYFVKKWHK